jgi:thiosulfate/3-mercaptopyruvate sulfurtransferase
MVAPMSSIDPRAAVFITPFGLAARKAAGEAVVVLAVYSDDSSAPRPWEAQPKIAGAIHTYLATDYSAPSDPILGSRPLPAIADLQLRVRQWGIDRNTAVVVYDHDGALQAARAWWVLKWAGLAEVLILDGGFAAWVAAGLPVDRAAPSPAPGNATLAPGAMPVLDADQAAALARTSVLIDTRISPNYEGGPTAPGEPRRGHIPAARSLPAASNLDAHGAFLDADRLRTLYGALVADGTRPVGVYCGAGVSAAHAVAALASIGVPSAMYPGSWSAWISDPARPVAIGPDTPLSETGA